MVLKDDNGDALPRKVKRHFDKYIQRIKKVNWFQPNQKLIKEKMDEKVNEALESFGFKVGIEYRKLEDISDWEAARSIVFRADWGNTLEAYRDNNWQFAQEYVSIVAWRAAFNNAHNAACEAVSNEPQNAAWYTTLDAFRHTAWNAIWNLVDNEDWEAARFTALGAARHAAFCAAQGARDLLSTNIEGYKKKYPDGNFLNLIPLWEMGIYPVGVVSGKFVVYIP